MTKNSHVRSAAFVELIALGLERALRDDPHLEAAWAGLLRHGLALSLRVEVFPGSQHPSVAVSFADDEVPEWNEEDRRILHSLGIAIDKETAAGLPADPRRHQSD